MLIILLPLLVCVAGALIHMGVEGKLSGLGKDMFWCGLLVTLFVVATRTIHIG